MIHLEDGWPNHLQGKISLEEKTLTNNSSFKKVYKIMYVEIVKWLKN